jgi:hypothetical protein
LIARAVLREKRLPLAGERAVIIGFVSWEKRLAGAARAARHGCGIIGAC